MTNLIDKLERADGPDREFPGGAPDQETHDLMAELSDLQTWSVLMATRGAPKATEAMDVIQKTRAFIVSRLFNPALRARSQGGE